MTGKMSALKGLFLPFSAMDLLPLWICRRCAGDDSVWKLQGRLRLRLHLLLQCQHKMIQQTDAQGSHTLVLVGAKYFPA